MTNFRAPNGNYYTRQLFWEEYIDLPIEKRAIEPKFTLYKDKPNLINFGKVYVQLKDPSGYRLAEKLFDGDYTLWTVLLNCRWFQAAKEVWDRELDASLVADGLEAIRDMAVNGMPAQKLAAAKYLANKEYRRDRTAGKGRPSKDDVAKAARDLAINDRDLQEDFKRIQKGVN